MKFDFYKRSTRSGGTASIGNPRHSTAELAREVGISTASMHHLLRKPGAPSPVRKARLDQTVNRGNNYYNRNEVLAFLRKIGAIQ